MDSMEQVFIPKKKKNNKTPNLLKHQFVAAGKWIHPEESYTDNNFFYGSLIILGVMGGEFMGHTDFIAQFTGERRFQTNAGISARSTPDWRRCNKPSKTSPNSSKKEENIGLGQGFLLKHPPGLCLQGIKHLEEFSSSL